MAHHSRQNYFAYLKQNLGEVPFSVDDGSLGIWKNCRQAWSLHDIDSEFSLVVQDDAILCRDFLKKAEEVLQEDAVYCLYVGRLRYYKYVKEAKEKGYKSFFTHHIANEVAIAIRTERIADMLDYCDKAGATSDREIHNWAKKRGLKVIYPMPSLVDHRDDGTLHNLDHGNYRRVATWFADDLENLRSHTK